MSSFILYEEVSLRMLEAHDFVALKQLSIPKSGIAWLEVPEPASDYTVILGIKGIIGYEIKPLNKRRSTKKTIRNTQQRAETDVLIRSALSEFRLGNDELLVNLLMEIAS